jgi:hypothetical protein
MATATKQKTRNRYFNPNPTQGKTTKRHTVGDCVVRAMCKATGDDWDTVFKELCEIGFELKAMPNDKITWKEYLDRKGFKKHSIKVVKGSKRPTVDSFCREHKTGTYVLSVANHLVTAVDGYNYDTWDPAECSLYGYWEKI